MYGATFSPLVPGRLLSVSDDATARAWTVREARGGAFVCAEKPVVLRGHTDKVRAHAWHPELRDVCFTGSWDGSIRVWDVVSGACLRVTREHLADVYDIGTHRDRPFRAVTCSRDSTMRFWSTERMVPSAKLRAVMGAEVIAAPAVGGAAGFGVSRGQGEGDRPERDARDAGGSDERPAGPDAESRRLVQSLSRSLAGAAIGGGAVAARAAAAPSACHKHEALFAALSGYASAEELWRLARIEAVGEGEARGPADDAAGAVVTPHVCEARALLRARADAAEADAALAKPGSARGAGGERRRRGRGMRDAEALARADVWLRLGDFASYCEACVEMGDAERRHRRRARGVPGVLGRHGGEARGRPSRARAATRAGVADAPGGGQARRRRRRAGGGGTRGRRLRRGVRGGRRRVPVAGSLGGGGGAARRAERRRISARPVFPRERRKTPDPRDPPGNSRRSRPSAARAGTRSHPSRRSRRSGSRAR